MSENPEADADCENSIEDDVDGDGLGLLEVASVEKRIEKFILFFLYSEDTHW